MMPWRAASFAVLLLLIAGPGLFAQGSRISLTIDQAIARALDNQPLLQQAQSTVEAARARVGEANSAFYPFINGSASYNRLSPQAFSIASALPPGLPLSSLIGSSPSPVVLGLLEAPLSLVPLNAWDFNVGLNQVIFQFGRRGIQVKLAESGVSAAQIGVDQIRASLAYQAAQGFYTVLFLKGQRAALDTQLANLKEHLDATRIKAQTGAATRYDELSTEVRISTLESQRIDAENQLARQTIGLEQLLGIEGSVTLDLQGEFTSGTAAPPDEQAQLALAMARRADVRQAAEAERTAELGRRLATASGWPTLSGHASVGYKNGILPDINTPALNWVAGVQLNVPIFQGLLVEKQGEEAESRLEAARENTLAVKRAAATQVLQAIQDLESAKKQIDTADAQLGQAGDMLEVVKLQYDLGMLTNLEYLDAQAALERAQLGSLLARYREVLNEYALKLATGTPIWASPQAASQN